jgi:electron transfer flavoprotein beta subunit
VRIVVPIKAVPDLVEEIELTGDGAAIDREYLTFVLNEWDGQALEEALLLKDADGAEVVAVGLADDPDIDQFLYTALAKGADEAVKLVAATPLGPPGPGGASGADRAALLAAYLAAHPADLVITGVQAADDLDGQLPSRLAALLDLPHVSVVIGVEAAHVEPAQKEGGHNEDGGASVTVRQEFAGGRCHELEVQLPAVIGVQSARQAPRYAPITRIRQAMNAGGLSELVVAAPAAGNGLVVRRLHRPETTGGAEMMTGSAREVAGQIVALLRARGLVKASAQ